jgi:FAD/FMN-containing dehydrogenase
MSIPPQRLNDVHSQLNPTWVRRVARPSTSEDVAALVSTAREQGAAISVSGCRHSMGGQQFATGGWHLDMRGMNRFLSLDRERRRARVQAGITWTELLAALEATQADEREVLTFRQKQTGADDLTLGGAVSSNIHGRGLTWAPMVGDIESLTLVQADGEVRRVSRDSNPDLFRLAVGGYGLFGVITEVEIRLVPRTRVERVVEITRIDGLAERLEQRIRDGFLMGDFQFCPDEGSKGFLQEGVFACYRPVDVTDAPTDTGLALEPSEWRELLVDAHHRKGRAWERYTRHYVRTHGQQYSHDRAQLGYYDPEYVHRVREARPELGPGSLMITELYVPRERIEEFMLAAARTLRRHEASLIYGTIRIIAKDDETFLPWARQNYACVVMNLRVGHTADGIARAQKTFRALIDLALERDGSFFLTYHRWATPEQVRHAYPRFDDFLQRKLRHDPEERLQSDWYRHWRGTLQLPAVRIVAKSS